jgi:PAS domain S-box-containing protein
MPLIDHEGNCIGTFGITKNITEIKELEIAANTKSEELAAQEEALKVNLDEMKVAQQDLAKEKSLLDALMNNLPDYIYFKDHDSKFIRISRSMLKLFPVKALEEMIGKSDFDFHKKEAAQQYYDEEMEIIKKKKGFIDQLQHEIMENGVEQWVSTTKLPLLDQKGNAIGTFGISKNVTSFKKLELEAKIKNDELQAQEEEIRQTMEEMKAIQDAMEEKEESYKKQIEKLKKGK